MEKKSRDQHYVPEIELWSMTALLLASEREEGVEVGWDACQEQHGWKT